MLVFFLVLSLTLLSFPSKKVTYPSSLGFNYLLSLKPVYIRHRSAPDLYFQLPADIRLDVCRHLQLNSSTRLTLFSHSQWVSTHFSLASFFSSHSITITSCLFTSVNFFLAPLPLEFRQFGLLSGSLHWPINHFPCLQGWCLHPISRVIFQDDNLDSFTPLFKTHRWLLSCPPDKAQTSYCDLQSPLWFVCCSLLQTHLLS